MPPALLRLLCQCEEAWIPRQPEDSKRRLVRQRSASESVLLRGRKPSPLLGSQSSDNLFAKDQAICGSTLDESGSESAEEASSTIDEAALIPLPLSEEEEINEEDEDYENPSRRHTIVAMFPMSAVESPLAMDPSSSNSSLISLQPPPLNFLETESTSSWEDPGAGRDFVSEAARDKNLLISLRELSDSETQLQRTQSSFLRASFEKTNLTLRHVASLTLLQTKTQALDINGPPSARSLPLESKPSLRRRVSSKLRSSFHRLSTLEVLSAMAGERNKEPAPDTPPQLAPLCFDPVSLEPVALDVRMIGSSQRKGPSRLSMHNRSRSTPLLKGPLFELIDFNEMNTDRRTSITADHNLLLLPSLHSQQPQSPAPKLDLDPPSQTGEDWLQSVLDAATETTGSS